MLENAEATKEPKVFSVEELNKFIRQTLESQLDTFWLKGEISNFKPHTSGHFYFSLKDPQAQISAVMFRGYNSKLKFKPADGMEVLVRGKISVYEPRGSYQIICDMMEPVGAGALQKAFEQLKLKLKLEGLFDSARKRPLPSFPKVIGIVTSETGAALQDMLNVLKRRNRLVEVILAPSQVQGDAAPANIVEQLQKLYLVKKIDVIIVGRGGGSIEDLWAFNNENVARTISQSPVPIISAVGHEIDFTIADFVADVRAPTPSAAAELVVQNTADIEKRRQQLQSKLILIWNNKFNYLKLQLQKLTQGIVDPKKKFQDLILRNDELQLRLQNAMQNFLNNLTLKLKVNKSRLINPQVLVQKAKESIIQNTEQLKLIIKNILNQKSARFSEQVAVLNSINPLAVLSRGFSVSRTNGKILTSIKNLKIGDSIQVELTDGIIDSKIDNITQK
jgi:exodeoxyribonuclease VII large subunit